MNKFHQAIVEIFQKYKKPDLKALRASKGIHLSPTKQTVSFERLTLPWKLTCMYSAAQMFEESKLD
jgi:hypothetical protein